MLKLWQIILTLTSSLCFVSTTSNWELAVAVTDHIDLISKFGNLVHKFKFENGSIESLSYDPVRRQLYFTDRNHPQFSIFQLDPALPPDTPATPLVKKQIETDESGKKALLSGISIDPLTQTLYWTVGPYIKYLKLSNSESEGDSGEVLHKFSGQVPFGLSVDICHRKLYWTLQIGAKGLIQKSDLDGKNKIDLTKTDNLPLGITVDQYTQRVFWTEEGGFSLMFIKSLYITPDKANQPPEIHVEVDNSHQPTGLSILGSRVFWTDYVSGTIYSSRINSLEYKTAASSLLKNYTKKGDSKVYGIVSFSQDSYLNPIDCKNVKKYQSQIDEEKFESIDRINNVDHSSNESNENGTLCLNGGTPRLRGTCSCLDGFTGHFCEISMCHNFCLHDGTCHVISNQPKCDCDGVWSGDRCESDACYGHCYNGGTCSIVMGVPKCVCAEGFGGNRCENHAIDQKHLCIAHCYLLEAGFDQQRILDLATDQNVQFNLSYLPPSCRCSEVINSNNLFSSKSDNSSKSSAAAILNGSAAASDDMSESSEHNWTTIVISVLTLICVLLSAFSTILIFKVKNLRKRPRIKKRIIVNKNVTPLTSRPHADEQCEITIENCCNMNICETPCFEPELRKPNNTEKHKKEEKRNLLTGIDLPPDDLY